MAIALSRQEAGLLSVSVPNCWGGSSMARASRWIRSDPTPRDAPCRSMAQLPCRSIVYRFASPWDAVFGLSMRLLHAAVDNALEYSAAAASAKVRYWE